MKLDKKCTVWINCRTEQEQEEILDIFESIGANWMHQKPREWRSYNVPMHYLLEHGIIRHGRTPVAGQEDYVNRKEGIIAEAKDFHNQWVSTRRENETR